MAEILGREGETKQHMLAWFQRRGFFRSERDECFLALNKLNARELDILAGHVTHAILHSK